MSNPAKVKVSVDALITRVEETLKEEEERYKEEMRQYNIALSAWKRDAIERLQDALSRAQDDDWDTTYRDEICIKCHIPDSPRLPVEPSGTASDLRLLKMAADDTLVIESSSKWSRYL